MTKATRRRPRRPRRSSLADQLRGVIHARRLTAYRVAKDAGLAVSVVDRFLNDDKDLGLTSFDAIATSLGLRMVEGRAKGRTTARVREPQTVDAEELASDEGGPDCA